MAAQAILDLELLGVGVELGADGALHALEVVGVNAREPLIGAVADLLLGVAQHRLPALGEVDVVAGQIPVPEALAGSFQGQGEALFAGCQAIDERLLLGADSDLLAGPSDGLANAGLVGEGLEQVVVDADAEMFDRRVDRRPVGHDHGEEVRSGDAELGDELERAAIGDVVFDERDVEALIASEGAGRGQGRGHDHLAGQVGEQCGHAGADLAVAIEDEDAAAGFGGGARHRPQA